MWSNILDRISFLSLFFVIVLLPVFFLPFTQIPVETSKGLLLVLGLSVSIIFWAVARFSDGKVTLPRSWLLTSGFLVVAVTLFSAFFSVSRQASMFGILFDLNSFWFIFAGFLLMFACSVVLRTYDNAKTVLFGVILSAAVVIVFQMLRFFFPAGLSFGVLGGSTESIFGSWNALGLFAGLSVLASLVVLDFFHISRSRRIMLQVFIVLSILMIAAVNFLLVWELLGIFALIIFVYKISFFSRRRSPEEGKAKFPAFSFIIVMASLFFFMSGQFIGSALPNRLGLSNAEVGPTFAATFAVAKPALAENPVLGAGPNKFGEVWAKHKPISINGGPFWDYSFSSGSGLLPTFAATTGGLGILSWLLFLTLFVVLGVKSIFSNLEKDVNKEVIAFFVLAFYLFICAFFYSTGSVLFLLALAFTGIFIGLSAKERPNGQMTILFLEDHRKSFFFILFLVLVMVSSAAASFKYIERFASVSYFRSTLRSTSVAEAEAAIGKALSLHVNDLYLRTYAQVQLAKLATLAQKGEDLTDAEKAELQGSVEQAVNGAQLATTYNSSNYLNNQALANVYSTVSALGVEDAYEKAVEFYQKAIAQNPLNPGLPLAISRTALANNKLKEAKEFANASLALKPNFLDALITLSQVSKLEGNGKDAISYAEQALALDPTNEALIDYVDSLKNGTSATPPPVDSTTPPPTDSNI